MKSIPSTGDMMEEGVSNGVGGKVAAVVDAGKGREGNALGGAMGRVRDNLLVVLEAEEVDREERPPLNPPKGELGELRRSSGIIRGRVSS